MAVIPHRGIRIADIDDRAADDFLEIDPRRRRYLASDDCHPRLDQCLAGNARLRVFGEDCVENGIGNLVGNFVGMPLGNGFRGEHEGVTHGIWSSAILKGGIVPQCKALRPSAA
jgi:hypothetical protein